MVLGVKRKRNHIPAAVQPWASQLLTKQVSQRALPVPTLRTDLLSLDLNITVPGRGHPSERLSTLMPSTELAPPGQLLLRLLEMRCTPVSLHEGMP